MTEANPLARSHQLLWEGLPISKKGPAPSLTLEQVIEAGIAIADSEGITALSMRRLAAELGMGTMSLYRYVPAKTELLNLMLDHVNGMQIGRTRVDGGWRSALESAAWAGRTLYLRHPWLLQINFTRPVLGPGSIAQFEEMMSALKDLPFRDQEKMTTLSGLDAYVTGLVREEILYNDAAAESGITADEFWTYQLPVLEAAMASGDYPTLAAMSDDTFDAGWEDTFASGLTLMLDGLENEVRRRRGAQAVRG